MAIKELREATSPKANKEILDVSFFQCQASHKFRDPGKHLFCFLPSQCSILNNFHHCIINTTFSSLLLLPDRESTVLSKPHLTPTSQRMKAQNFHTCPRASLDANFLACVTIVTAGCTHSPVLPLKEWRQKLLRLWWLRFEVHHNFWNEDPLSFAEHVLLYNGFV